jgi:hypothetical protein
MPTAVEHRLITGLPPTVAPWVVRRPQSVLTFGIVG